jgi:predicted DNA-binding transcriptional regulator YafY
LKFCFKNGIEVKLQNRGLYLYSKPPIMVSFTHKLKKLLVFETKRHIISKYDTFVKRDIMPISKNARKRFILIDGILKSHKRYSIREIAEKVNEQLEEDGFAIVSERMIYNDIQMMQEEYPVNIIKKDGKYQYETRDESITNEILDQKDRELIEMALQTFSIYKGSGLFEKFDDVITRLMAGSVLRRLNKSDHKKYIQIGELTGKTGQEWIELIYDAIVNYKSLKMHYKPYGGETKIRTISPYLLKEYRNVWYMVASVKEMKHKGGTNLFKLNRIQKIEQCDEMFEIDDKFSAEDYFKYSLGVFHVHAAEPIEVRLKFNKNLIPLISETKIHPSMEIISKTEEEMVVTFTVYNTIELKNKILSYGANAEVLSPKELRNEIIGIIDQAKILYSK